MKYFRALIVFIIKYLSIIFYRTNTTWLTPQNDMRWQEIRVVAFLNHTSLFEPLFIAALPNQMIWRAIQRLVVPVADVTLKRPLVGRLFKIMAPEVVALTRKRDDSWAQFMEHVKDNSLILIFPEGRMKRLDGLDKNGKPMSVKAGIVDILNKVDSGYMAICYSGGLHHVQAPGQLIPHLFKTIELKVEQVDIAAYKKSLGHVETGQNATDQNTFRANVVRDLEARQKKWC